VFFKDVHLDSEKEFGKYKMRLGNCDIGIIKKQNGF
jgi:hypothetical protein